MVVLKLGGGSSPPSSSGGSGSIGPSGSSYTQEIRDDAGRTIGYRNPVTKQFRPVSTSQPTTTGTSPSVGGGSSGGYGISTTTGQIATFRKEELEPYKLTSSIQGQQTRGVTSTTLPGGTTAYSRSISSGSSYRPSGGRLTGIGVSSGGVISDSDVSSDITVKPEVEKTTSQRETVGVTKLSGIGPNEKYSELVMIDSKQSIWRDPYTKQSVSINAADQFEKFGTEFKPVYDDSGRYSGWSYSKTGASREEREAQKQFEEDWNEYVFAKFDAQRASQGLDKIRLVNYINDVRDYPKDLVRGITGLSKGETKTTDELTYKEYNFNRDKAALRFATTDYNIDYERWKKKPSEYESTSAFMKDKGEQVIDIPYGVYRGAKQTLAVGDLWSQKLTRTVLPDSAFSSEAMFGKSNTLPVRVFKTTWDIQAGGLRYIRDKPVSLTAATIAWGYGGKAIAGGVAYTKTGLNYLGGGKVLATIHGGDYPVLSAGIKGSKVIGKTVLGVGMTSAVGGGLALKYYTTPTEYRKQELGYTITPAIITMGAASYGYTTTMSKYNRPLTELPKPGGIEFTSTIDDDTAMYKQAIKTRGTIVKSKGFKGFEDTVFLHRGKGVKTGYDITTKKRPTGQFVTTSSGDNYLQVTKQNIASGRYGPEFSSQIYTSRFGQRYMVDVSGAYGRPADVNVYSQGLWNRMYPTKISRAQIGNLNIIGATVRPKVISPALTGGPQTTAITKYERPMDIYSDYSYTDISLSKGPQKLIKIREVSGKARIAKPLVEKTSQITFKSRTTPSISSKMGRTKQTNIYSDLSHDTNRLERVDKIFKKKGYDYQRVSRKTSFERSFDYGGRRFEVYGRSGGKVLSTANIVPGKIKTSRYDYLASQLAGKKIPIEKPTETPLFGRIVRGPYKARPSELDITKSGNIVTERLTVYPSAKVKKSIIGDYSMKGFIYDVPKEQKSLMNIFSLNRLGKRGELRAGIGSTGQMFGGRLGQGQRQSQDINIPSIKGDISGEPHISIYTQGTGQAIRQGIVLIPTTTNIFKGAQRDTQINRPRDVPIFGERLPSIEVPQMKNIESVKSATAIRQVQSPLSISRTSTVTIPTTITPITPPIRPPTFGSSNIFFNLVPTEFKIFEEDNLDYEEEPRRKRKFRGKKLGYTPSISAYVFDIRGKKPKLKKGELFSGLELRPIPTTAKSRRR